MKGLSPRWLQFGATALTVAAFAVTGGAGSAAASTSDPAAGPSAPFSAVAIPPAQDPFYTPPVGYQSDANGTILRSRQVLSTVLGLPVPENVYQLLIKSTDSQGNPIAAMTTVFVPLTPPTGGSRKLLSYQIAIDSLGSSCNPSYEMRIGTEKEITGIGESLSQGWDVVTTDFEGPEMAMFAGPISGHVTLDGIRAAEAFVPDGLSSSTAVAGWGYSGGGQATAWAAQEQASYAPGLNLVGWVAGDFPANMATLLPTLDGGPFSGFEIGGAIGISRDYPQLAPLFNAAGVAKAQQMGSECQIPIVALNPYETLGSFTNVDVSTNPTAQAVLAANSLGATGPTAPTLLQSGTNDEIIPGSQGSGLNQQWCAEGGNVQFQQSAVPEHVLNDFATIPSSESWIEDRFAGVAFHSTC